MGSQAQMEGLAFDRKRLLAPLHQREEGEDVLDYMGREGKGAPFWWF